MAEAYPGGTKIPREEIARARRHVFLCVGPDCCDASEGQEVWETLKLEAKKLKVPILRTKAACLRVCQGGPWLVVYPEGTWYGRVDCDRLRRILREHVENGQPIEEWISVHSCQD